MTLKIFEQELREECKIAYSDLETGERKKKLKKRQINSLTDIFFENNNPLKIYRSCVITFGNVLENTAMRYAKVMGYKTWDKKNFMGIKIDILFQIVKTIYNLESKANIELDAGKTRRTLEMLNKKHKVIINSQQANNIQVISKILVWTKANAKEAAEIAKTPLEEKYLMGIEDFFRLFSIEVKKEEFFEMIRKVWNEEVEPKIKIGETK